MHMLPRRFAVVFAAILLALAFSSCGFTDYWVSVKGNDATGNGTQSNPWRTITYALTQLNYNTQIPPRIRLTKGLYEESFTVTKSVNIRGAGVAPIATWPDDPLTPTQEVSAIIRPRDANGQFLDGIRVANGAHLVLDNLVVLYGNVRAANAQLSLLGVEVRDSRGLFGVQIENSPFSLILNSKVTATPNIFADYAIEIIQSDVGIGGLTAGDYFDHVISIRPPDNNDPLEYGSGVPYMNITIKDSTIHGSSIWYADGIRIQGTANVEILNTTIARTHADAQAAGDGIPHNMPYAGVEIAGWTLASMPNVVLDGVTTSGFDVGIGLNMEGEAVRVQNSDISGVSYGVLSNFHGYELVTWPLVDFGGGLLGSQGNNTFSAAPPWAFYHPSPYFVAACGNHWIVPDPQVDPERIYDRLDVPQHGRVDWDCVVLGADAYIYYPPDDPPPTQPPEVTPAPTAAGSTALVNKDTPCYSGPGPLYVFHNTLFTGTELALLGYGAEGGWLVAHNPRFTGLQCWVDEDDLDYPGDPDSLPRIPIPPLPTRTPTPSATFTPTPTLTPTLPCGPDGCTPTPGR
jgi:hypothetical protein